jgi:hypothetical protein
MFWILLSISIIVRLKILRPKKIVSGIVQDIFIALQLSILPKILAFPLASFASLYIIFDAMLFWQLKTRMHPSYFIFFKQARSFFDSALALGLKKFLAVGAAIAACLVCAPTTSFSWLKVILLAALGIVGFKGSSYKLDNAFFSLQLYPFKFLRKKKTELLGLPSFLIPPSENAVYLSPMYPLLKHTKGFEGVKQFDISLDEKKPPHIIFLMLESFRAKDVNARATPCFEKLKQEGIYFSQFYSNGVLTHQSVVASLFGIYPFFGSLREHAIFDEPPHQVDFSSLPLIGIGDLLQKRGYHTAYIDAAQSLDSEKKFFHDHGFETVVGRHDFSKGSETSWGIYDKKLMEYGAAFLERECNKERPLFTVLFTVSNHHPWQTPRDYGSDMFDDIEDEVYRKFLRTMRYADNCLELLISSLKEKQLDRNLILFIMGDHGQGMGEHGLDRFQNSVYEENVHIPLLIWAPGKIAKPLQIETVSSQIDLLPTLMDLLGLKGLNHAMGKTLLRKGEAPLFYNNAHIGFSLGCRLGPYKYVYSDLLDTKAELFNIGSDPEEKNNLFEIFPDIAQKYETMAHECYRFMYSLYGRGNFTLSSKQMVDCSRLFRITDDELKNILEDAAQPHTINLSGCLSLTDTCLTEMVPYASNLKHLNLTDCLISYASVQAFLVQVPHLRELHLKSCPLLTYDEIATLKSSHSNIKIYTETT